MHTFKYRTPRYPMDVPVRLTLGDGSITGRCREISKEGMRLELEEPLSPNYAGTVSLRYEDLAVALPVQYAHSDPPQEGVRFAFVSDKQRHDVARLVALVAANSRPSAIVLVK
jgi:hypothetical protein